MVRIVSGGVAEFDALAYQERHPGTVQYLSTQLQNLVSAGRSVFTEAGNRFMEGARAIHERLLGDDALRRARALARSVTNAFQRDEIRPLCGVEEAQNANSRMQRWIMANQKVREMYHNQQLDGYADTYLDLAPGQRGEDHYDYRRVMDGVVQDCKITNAEGEEEESWMMSFYFEGELAEGDRKLDVTEVSHILSTWDAMQAILAAGEGDPTNPFGGSL